MNKQPVRFLIIALLILFLAAAPAVVSAADFQPLIGRWQRTDGGYVIEIRNIAADGKIEAGYYNPRPINVELARASMSNNYVKVEVTLRDRGYPGSAYTLVYDQATDRLVGLYYHALSRQNFDVVFIRQK